MSLWPMNKQTGATVIVPRSHSPENVAHIQSYREKHNVDWDAMSESEQRNFTEHFTSIGLQPGILNAAAGDLCFFDTALYHGVCHGADPLANGECDHRPPLHAPTRPLHDGGGSLCRRGDLVFWWWRWVESLFES